jgi:hypothetical protein
MRIRQLGYLVQPNLATFSLVLQMVVQLVRLHYFLPMRM